VSHEIQRITTEAAPQAIGPYCQAVAHNGLLFCSGQIPIDPETSAMVEGDIKAKTRRCLENLTAVCAEANTSLDRAIKMTVYVRDLGLFGDVNEAYAEFFPDNVPARTTVQISALPAGADVEVDAIVALEG
jgi:2-iminobutanoate/2-iminopropanoate deaminase